MRRRLRRAFVDVWRVLTAALLVCSAAGSLAGAAAWRSSVRAGSERAFASTAEAAQAALGNALQRDADLTATARTLIELTPSLTNAALRRWFDTLRSGEQYPGAFGMIYIERLARGQLPGFMRTIRRDPPFDVVPLSGTPPPASGLHPELCLTRYGVHSLPPGQSPVVAGFTQVFAALAPSLDFCRLPVGSLLRAAAATGEGAAAPIGQLLESRSAASSLLDLVLPKLLRAKGLIVTVAPVYASGGTPRTSAQRTATVAGWTMSMVEVGAIVTPLLDALHGGAITVAFVNPTGQRVVLDAAGRSSPHDLSRSFDLNLGGRYIVTISSPPVTSNGSANGQFAVVLAIGIVISLLLAGLVRTLSRSRSRALLLADSATSELRRRALHDSLTGLPNRALIFHRTGQLLAGAIGRRRPVSVLFIDLDGFKDINDTYGHLVGDELLCEVAGRFRLASSGADMVGRLGGDEFVVLVELIEPGLDVALARELIACLREPFALGGSRALHASISASVGIASGMRKSAEDLLREADIALYEAKRQGKSRCARFEPGMLGALQHRLALERDLRRAVEENELFVEFQPLVDLADLRLVGAEALVRWRHPDRGLVPPAEFVPLLEVSGAIVEVGALVLRRACAEAARWHAAGLQMGVSVNVSAAQLEHGALLDVVGEVLREHGLDPGLLTLEITETAAMRDTARSKRVLAELKALGVGLAIDDFGTGYSSLSYLQQFAADSIKIDRTFIAALGDSSESGSLVSTMIQLARSLGLRTTAEGVEQEWQLQRLRDLGCDLAQGYYFHRPLAPAAMLELVRRAAKEKERVTSATAAGPNGTRVPGPGGAPVQGAPGTGAKRSSRVAGEGMHHASGESPSATPAAVLAAAPARRSPG